MRNTVYISDIPGGGFSLRLSVLDRHFWNCTRLMGVLFPTPWPCSSALVFVWGSILANVLLGLIGILPTSCNRCCSWCWNKYSKSLHLTWINIWISHSNRAVALCRSVSDHLVATCQALFRHSSNCLQFVVISISALYTWTTIAAKIVLIFCSCYSWHSLANGSFSLAFTDFIIFALEKQPSAWNVALLHCLVLWGMNQSDFVG